MLRLIDVNVALDTEQGRKHILKDVNLSLERKKIYVMTGPNGGGKSTVAKAIMGILPVESGDILLDEKSILPLSITERAKLGIGYAFQAPARFKGLTVSRMLEVASGKSRKNEQCGFLFDVGLCADDYLQRVINAGFSGGELKRVEIASILARKPKVALFDEPEAGIDLWSFSRLTETFEKLNRDTDTTIVIISHQERIMRLADEVILVADGRIAEITTQEKFLEGIAQSDAACDCRRNCIKGGEWVAGCDR